MADGQDFFVKINVINQNLHKLLEAKELIKNNESNINVVSALQEKINYQPSI